MSNADQPTQFTIDKIEIEGRDIKGLLVSLEYYESIFIPATGGTLTIMDSSKAGFIEENNIEFIEDFSFSFQNANGETLEFEGKLNGLRNEMFKQQLKEYCIDYTSKPVRKNEQEFVTERFKNKNPKNVVEDMVKLMGGNLDSKGGGSGEPMNFIGNRRRPTDIIRYVCTHGLSGKSSVEDPQASNPEPQTKKIKGTTGFLCWGIQNDKYRFASVKDVMEGSAGEETEEYEYKMMNHGESLQEAMTSIMDIQFKQIGDYQSHQRGGAFNNVLVSFDLDKGLYAEFTQKDDSESTSKQREETERPSRYFSRCYQPEAMQNECSKAPENKWDQSRKCLSQNAVSQNTAVDTLGYFTIAPTFKIQAGDVFKCKVNKVYSEGTGGYDKKHSGKYIVKSVGHHFGGDGRAYTRLNTMRSTKQQNDASS